MVLGSFLLLFGSFLSSIPLISTSETCQYSGISSLSSINCANFALRNGKLTLRQLQLVNSRNEVIQLRGLSSHGIHWFPQCVTFDSIRYAVMNYGINLYRIVIYIDSEENGYESDPSYFDNYIDDIITWCESLGIYVIIDWHVLTPGDPNAWLTSPGANTGLAIDFWTKMASLYKDKSFVLYEISNEPNNVDWTAVLQYHNSIISAIRNIDPTTIILAGTTTWSQDIHLADQNPVQQPYNVMYSFHFYAATHSFLYTRLVEVSKLIPVFVNEWGFSSASGDDPINSTVAKLYLDYMSGITDPNSPILSWAVWSYCDKDESSALLKPSSCQSQSWSQLSCSGEYLKSYALNSLYGSNCNNVMSTSTSSDSPSRQPTNLPTTAPTLKPSLFPSRNPTSLPSFLPTRAPSFLPTRCPSFFPTRPPSSFPSPPPSLVPTFPPSPHPSVAELDSNTACPSRIPSTPPTIPPSLAIFSSLLPTPNSLPPTFSPTFSQPSSYPSQPGKSSSASESASLVGLMGPHGLYLISLVLVLIICVVTCCILRRRGGLHYKAPDSMKDNVIITEVNSDFGNRYQTTDHVPISVNPMTRSPRIRQPPSPSYQNVSISREEISPPSPSSHRRRAPNSKQSPPSYQMTKFNLQEEEEEELQAF